MIIMVEVFDSHACMFIFDERSKAVLDSLRLHRSLAFLLRPYGVIDTQILVGDTLKAFLFIWDCMLLTGWCLSALYPKTHSLGW